MLTSSVAKQIEFRFLEGPGAKQRKEVTRRRAETIPMPPWSQARRTWRNLEDDPPAVSRANRGAHTRAPVLSIAQGKTAREWRPSETGNRKL